MVGTDRSLVTLVRAGSLLTVWSGVMPSEEIGSEYNVFVRSFSIRELMFLLKHIVCILMNAHFDVHFYVFYGISRLWLQMSLWFTFLDHVLT
jgi:hypothetical protein